MRIALSVITKGDEELENLKKCIASFYPYIDGIFITANQEATKTKKWAQKYKKINFSYLKWSDDFSKQRNYNFSQIKDYDWIVWADSDDILVGGEYLREIARISQKNNFDCVFFDYYYGCLFDGEPSFENIKHIDLIQKRERLLKPNIFYWKGRLHETPIPNDNYQPKYTYVSYSKDFPVVWLHTETDRDPQSPKNIERMKRNQRILEAQLEDERKTKEGADPRTLLYLMKIYIELNDKNLYLKTLNMGQEYLQKSGWDEERALCLQIMSKAYEMLGDIKKAITHALASINEYPYSSLTYLYLAKYYIEDNNFEKAEHWLDQALTIKEKEKTQMNNELEKKTLAGELALKINFTHKKDIRKSYKIAKYLYDLLETKETKETYQAIKDLYELDIASEGVHKLFKYLEKTKEEGKIIDIYKTLPKEIKELEFAVYYKNKYTYRKWKTDEICYYIGQHFEVWSPDSLKTGIGGSETAVIKLSNEWQKQGYQVVVYGGVIKPKVYNGVLWLPHFYFNLKDDFNIFIQWRSCSLAGKIKCKKFLVDLHDLYSPLSIDWDRIDYVMVKSQFHRNLAKHIPDYKFKIISNGV